MPVQLRQLQSVPLSVRRAIFGCCCCFDLTRHVQRRLRYQSAIDQVTGEELICCRWSQSLVRVTCLHVYCLSVNRHLNRQTTWLALYVGTTVT
jgi:hypothetical protein